MISGYGEFFDLDHKRSSGDVFSNFQNKYFEPTHVKPAVVEGEKGGGKGRGSRGGGLGRQ